MVNFFLVNRKLVAFAPLRKRAALCLSVSVRMAVGLRGLSVNILMLTDERAPR